MNSSLDSTGIHHSGIEGTVTAKATGQPVANATVTISAPDMADKITTTDLNGAYHIDRISAGDYTVNVVATGFTTQTVTHHIVRGKIDELDWQL
ncbi:MAG: carboxypeptidase-like regulatory domain-containing protein [Ferruginibacter sp.]